MTYDRVITLLMIGLLVVLLFRPLTVSVAAVTGQGTPAVAASGKPDVLTVIHQRKSVRAYTAEPVTKPELRELVRAGMAAPTARNAQPWAFIVVTQREKLDALSECSANGKMLKQAKAAIVVCGVEKEFLSGEGREMWAQDCSAATQNILLAAEGMGLGAVWIGIYPVKERVAAVRKAMKLPADSVPFCLISIGRPTGVEQPKDKFKPAKIHYEEWGGKEQ